MVRPFSAAGVTLPCALPQPAWSSGLIRPVTAVACTHSFGELCISEKKELSAFVRLKAEQLECVRPGPSSPLLFQLILDDDLHALYSAALNVISPHVEVRATLGQRLLVTIPSRSLAIHGPPFECSGEEGRLTVTAKLR